MMSEVSMRPWRVVFMGSPEFAVSALQSLIAHDDFNVVAIYSQPDAVSRRGNKEYPTPVKEVGLYAGIPVNTPQSLRDTQEQEILSKLNPDFIVVAAYGKILPEEVLDIPRFGCINLHGSLLPRWRGAAPIQRAILAHDEATGVCVMQMEEGLDTGDYCATVSTSVDDKSATQLTHELAILGANIVCPALLSIASGSVVWTKQDESLVTYAHKITKEELILNTNDTVRSFVSKVRASSDSSPAKLTVGADQITILDCVPATDIVECEPIPGTFVVSKSSIACVVADGVVQLTSVKKPGKAAMSARDWARGARLETGGTWN